MDQGVFVVLGNLANVAMAILGVLIVAWVAYRLTIVAEIYRGVRDRRHVELQGVAPRPPTSVVHAQQRLADLGFRHLAELGTKLPGRREVFIEWVLVSDDGTVAASLVPIRSRQAFVALLSWFDDGSFVETQYPARVRLVQPGIDLEGHPLSLKTAVESHVARLRSGRAIHGEPRRLTSVADLHDLDAAYRTRVARSVLWRPTRRALLVLTALGAAGLLLAVGSVFAVAPILAT